jgi:hypothetical protein
VSLNLAKLSSTGVPFRVEAIQEYGRLAIIRLLVAKGAEDSFVVEGLSQSATVVPPKPFSGKGEYNGCPTRSSPEWRGAVKVSLPGLSNITFGGNKFTFSFEPGGRCPPDK